MKLEFKFSITEHPTSGKIRLSWKKSESFESKNSNVKHIEYLLKEFQEKVHKSIGSAAIWGGYINENK